MKIPEPTANTSPAGKSAMLGRKNANTVHLDEMGSCANRVIRDPYEYSDENSRSRAASEFLLNINFVP